MLSIFIMASYKLFVLSSLLSNLYCKQIFREALEGHGCGVNGEIINLIWYEDYTAILTDKLKVLQYYLNRITETG